MRKRAGMIVLILSLAAPLRMSRMRRGASVKRYLSFMSMRTGVARGRCLHGEDEATALSTTERCTMAIGALSARSSRSAVSTSAVPMVSVWRASLICRPGISEDEAQRRLAHEILLGDPPRHPFVDIEIGQQERRAQA
jgi:hypothetical protein